MPDPYANIVETDPSVVVRIAERLEVRAADPNQRAMLASYLDRSAFVKGAQVLEVGCGTGAVARAAAARREVASVTAIDPSAVLIETAQKLAEGLTGLTFRVGDGRALPFEPEAFDGVIFHTTLCHIPNPEQALLEASRVLRPGGKIAVFDGDYATATVATAEFDPLQACSRAVTANNVLDRWLVRRLPRLLSNAGFTDLNSQSHGYFDNEDPDYMLGHAERGAELLEATGVIGRDLALALKQEARRRAADGTFFGHIAYASFIARKA
jgi:ubiquinone/menaquinone biosynthesis C-methylase UbiE